MNITDIDDKILKRAAENKEPWQDLSRRFEKSFFEDMDKLNILRPSFVPRATEFMEEMIHHIKMLEEKKVAYIGRDSGSVYFDTTAFDEQVETDLKYGQLDPSRRNAPPNTLESEKKSEKKNEKDFVLWKRTNENHWPSPWGEGRPGWHTECSAMINATAGTIKGDGKLDIHGGGIDLKFPHHENERAQSQCLMDCCSSWTSHFIYSGHLHIHGQKMSKSLKNFVTLEALFSGESQFPIVTPRQLRLLFLNVRYYSPFEFTTESIHQAKILDSFIAEFFANVSYVSSGNDKWNPDDTDIMNASVQFRNLVVEKTSDDFNFPAVLIAVREFISVCNGYMFHGKPKRGVLQNAALGIATVLQDLGVHTYEDAQDGVDGSLVDALSDFRWEVRAAALAGDSNAVLVLCDQLRDDVLPHLGVQLKDVSGGSQWRKGTENKDNKSDSKVLERNKKEKNSEKYPPGPASQMFKSHEFSEFDEHGFPTHDANGQPLGKNKTKKLRKIFDARLLEKTKAS